MLPTASCSCCARTPAPCDSFRGPARGPPGRETAVLLTAAGCCGSDAAVEVPTGCAVAARPRHALLAAPAAVLVLGARAVLAGAEAVLPADAAGLDAAEPPKKLVMLLWFDGVAGGGFFLGICAYRLASCCHCCCISCLLSRTASRPRSKRSVESEDQPDTITRDSAQTCAENWCRVQTKADLAFCKFSRLRTLDCTACSLLLRQIKGSSDRY